MSAKPIPGRCGRKKSSGKGYCEAYPIKGASVCRKHGGAAPQVKRAAEVRAAKVEAISEAERMVARAGVDAHPLDHLLESLHRAAALVEVWGVMVAGLDEKGAEESDEIRGEVEYDQVEHEHGVDVVVTPKDRLLTVNNRGEAMTHPFVDEYNKALERRAKFAKMCLDAGIEERRVKLAEEQGQMVVKVISTILDDLKIKRTSDVNKIVGKALRHLEPQYG